MTTGQPQSRHRNLKKGVGKLKNFPTFSYFPANLFFTGFINNMLIISNQQNYNPLFGTKNIPRAELEMLLAKDKSSAQIARKFGVTTGTIMRKIREYGLQLPSEKLRERFYNEALPLLEQGVSYANVRKLTGISEEYSRKWLKKNSYPSNKVLFAQHLEELYKQNYTDEQIADILYVEVSTIARRRGDLGLKRKLGRPQSNIDWQEILEMLKSGKTAPQIVKEFKISAKLLAEKIKEISGVTPKKIELEYRKNFVANCLAKGDNISSIAEKLNLSKEDIELAELIGLLHDIGRFEELKITKELNSVKFDHATHGSTMLFENGMIRNFIEDSQYDEIIKKSIENHSRLVIEKGLNERELLHSKIIRDADKLDNYRVKKEEKIEAIFPKRVNKKEDMEECLLSDKVYETVLNRECVNIYDRVTPLDFWVCILAFTFDLNFDVTYNIVKENDYINILIDRFDYKDIDTSIRMENIRNIINKFIDEKITNFK